MADTQLKALFDGVIARKLVTDFRNVQAREPVLLLQDDSGFEVVVDVPEGDLARRQREDVKDRKAWSAKAKPMVELSSLPGKQFPAVLKEFSTSADASTRTYRVTLSMERPEGVSILSGMTAKVVFTGLTTTPEKDQFVPAQAVVAGPDGQPYVWVIARDSMAASKRPVQVGELTGDHILVRGGLERGEAIATTGVHKLAEGMVVREMEISDETRR